MTAPVTGWDEHALVLRAQDGEVSAFEELVDRHQGRLFRVAYLVLHDRQDAEDVVQEALVLAWRRLPLLEDPSAFRAWISRIATRAATDVVRRAARRATDSADQDAIDLAGSGTALGSSSGRGTHDPARAAEANAQLESLAGILQSIDEELRTSWVLREIDGMSYREIGEVVGATTSTVRGRIARARTAVLQSMEGWR